MPGSGTARRRSIVVEAMTDWKTWEKLEPEWNTLLGRSRAESLFLKWEWIKAWGDIARESVEPLVLVARDERGELVGAAPLYRTKFRLAHTMPYRALRVMGDVATGAVYGDWPAREDCEQEALSALALALACRRDWDCLWMPNVASWTGAGERLRGACSSAGLPWNRRSTSFSVIRLPETFDEYLTSLPPEHRKSIRRAQRKILGQPGVRVAVCRTPEELPRFLDALFALHEKRWGRKGDPGVFRRKPNEARFYKAFVPEALRLGWLRFIGIEDDSGLHAVEIGYVCGNVFASLQGGFDPDYERGIGTAVRLEAVRACIQDGIGTFDYLGDFNADKRHFGAVPREGSDLLIVRPTLKGGLLLRAGFWPTGRYLRPAGPDLRGAPTLSDDLPSTSRSGVR